MKTFHIKHEGNNITLETNSSKWDSLERLMYMIACHFVSKGQIKRLESIIGLLEVKIENFKDIR